MRRYHRLFHGGVRGLVPGDTLLPASKTGATGAAERMGVLRQWQELPQAKTYSPDFLHLTTDPEAAAAFGATVPGCNRRSHTGDCGCTLSPWSTYAGDLYEVYVIGEIEPEGPDVDFPGYARAQSAGVLSVIRRSLERWHIDWPLDPDAPWFHGGTPGLQVGDELLPSDDTGIVNGLKDIVGDHWSTGDRCYATQRLDTARWFASRHPFGGRTQAGDVYIVEPVGRFEADPASTRLHGLSACAPRLRIVAVKSRGVRRFTAETTENPAWVLNANVMRSREGLPPLPFPEAGVPLSL